VSPRRLLPLLLILLAIAGWRWMTAIDTVLPAPRERLINHGLQRATAAGWPARVVRAEGDRAVLESTGHHLQASESQDVTYLLISEDSVAFVPSRGVQALLSPERIRILYRWVEMPLRFKKTDIALQSLAMGFCMVLVDAGKLPRLPPLPPLPSIPGAEAIERPEESADWGVPLALLIPLALWGARRRAGSATVVDT